MSGGKDNVIEMMPAKVHKAFAFWQSHDRSDKATAKFIEMHVNSVFKWKHKYNWTELADNIDRKVAEQTEEDLVTTQVVSTVGMVTNIEAGLALILKSPEAVAQLITKPQDAKILMDVRDKLLGADNTADGEHKTEAQKKAASILHDKFKLG